jgi:hypothetical protein
MKLGLIWGLSVSLLVGCASSTSSPESGSGATSSGSASGSSSTPTSGSMVVGPGTGFGSGATTSGANAATTNDAGGYDAGGPMLLSQTGLYADIAEGTLGPGVYAYQPQYALWADGATKNRWVKIPDGTQIDTSNMDFFKEFALDGVRLETRMLLKNGAGDWFMMAYQWNSTQTEAVAVPNGVLGAAGTTHDIPSSQQCGMCHGEMVDRVLGFTAVQLSHNIPGSLNIDQISTMRWLTNPPTTTYVVPGDPTAQAALGYLHANCGLCHNYRSLIYSTAVQMDVWLEFGISDLQMTPTFMTLVGQLNTGDVSHLSFRILPGNPMLSAVHELMDIRAAVAGPLDDMRQMPPLASNVVDTTGLASVDAWIKELPADAGP